MRSASLFRVARNLPRPSVRLMVSARDIVTVSSDSFYAETLSAPCACSLAEFLVLRCVNTPTPFSPLLRYGLNNNIVLAWFFYVVFPSPCTMCRMGTHTPSPLQCVHFRLWGSCVSGTYTFLFRVHATRVLVFFSRYFWTCLLLSGYCCAQRTTDRGSVLSFLLGESVRERLVRVFASGPTLSVQFHLGGTSIVSVIASWLSEVLPYSLSIIEAPTTFDVV